MENKQKQNVDDGRGAWPKGLKYFADRSPDLISGISWASQVLPYVILYSQECA